MDFIVEVPEEDEPGFWGGMLEYFGDIYGERPILEITNASAPSFVQDEGTNGYFVLGDIHEFQGV
jgi:hypothetical protein